MKQSVQLKPSRRDADARPGHAAEYLGFKDTLKMDASSENEAQQWSYRPGGSTMR